MHQSNEDDRPPPTLPASRRPARKSYTLPIYAASKDEVPHARIGEIRMLRARVCVYPNQHNGCLMESTPAHNIDPDELERLELRVAQRADELARTSPRRTDVDSDREMWLRAENELLQSFAHLPVSAGGK